MARRRRTGKCVRCGRYYNLCRYNAHHQKYCTDPACVAERRRERQRDNYRKRYRKDELFRKAEQARCRQNIRQRRARCKTVTTPPQNPPESLDFELFATGLLAQMIDSSDPKEVHSAARALQQRGQRLALSAQSSRGSPY